MRGDKQSWEEKKNMITWKIDKTWINQFKEK